MSTSGRGIGCGTVLALIISVSINGITLWLIPHGFFGWFYVVYVAFGGGR